MMDLLYNLYRSNATEPHLGNKNAIVLILDKQCCLYGGGLFFVFVFFRESLSAHFLFLLRVEVKARVCPCFT